MAPRHTDSPLLFELADKPDFAHEQRLVDRGSGPVAGVDEAGRGPLAGPVVAAAVILDPHDIPCGLDDSKKLTLLKRERLFDQIVERAAAVSLVSLCARSIDASDIRAASLEAMRRAINALHLAPGHVLADGRDVPPLLPCACTALVKGDARSVSIAAASIVAKVSRDRMMVRTCDVYRDYGFSSHKGYGSEGHRRQLAEHGPVPGIHRYTFAPLRKT